MRGEKNRELCILSFTVQGAMRSLEIREKMKPDVSCILYTKCRRLQNGEEDLDIAFVEESAGHWAGVQFAQKKAMLFIGACGIAVRSIAPFLRDKLKDPPVLVMDEAGSFVIPLLSGHFGGANELAAELAQRLGAVLVTTTATDVNHLFAVDVFAAKNGLAVEDRSKIAEVSASLLETKKFTMSIAGTYTGTPPAEAELIPYPPKRAVDVLVAVQKEKDVSAVLSLHPRKAVLGIGCKKGKSLAEIESFIFPVLQAHGVPFSAVFALATVDRKKEEAGILAFAGKYALPLLCYTPEELAGVKGSFSASSFVRQQVGVDNVCERAACLAAGEGSSLKIEKTAGDGITLAVTEKQWSVRFDEA